MKHTSYIKTIQTYYVKGHITDDDVISAHMIEDVMNDNRPAPIPVKGALYCTWVDIASKLGISVGFVLDIIGGRSAISVDKARQHTSGTCRMYVIVALKLYTYIRANPHLIQD